MIGYSEGGNINAGKIDFNPRLPNGVLVAIFMVVGFIGNSLVLYVYHFKMPRTVFSTFVKALALLDLCTTVSGMPLDVVMKTIVFDSWQTLNILCKITHCEVYGTSLASGSILLLIAVTRYHKVCHPLQPSLNRRQARTLCTVIFFVCMALSTITLVINGPESVMIILDDMSPSNHGYPKPSGTTTSASLLLHLMNASHEGPAPVSINADQSLLSVNNIIVNVPVNNSGETVKGNSTVEHSMTNERVVTIDICRVAEQHKRKALYYALSSILMAAFAVIFLLLVVLHCRISYSINRFQRRRSNLNRPSITSDDSTSSMTSITTSMYRIFATITIVFLVSYLPHLICLIIEPAVYGSGTPMLQHWRMIMDLAYNSPYINVISNPFIYGYRSAVFRKHCIGVVGNCFCCRRKYI